jgi:hypothetical protein
MNTILPAGKYYIGDLCYVMNEVWDMFCDNLTPGTHTIEYNGHHYHYWWAHTANGDGLYLDQQLNRFPVDAGLIGIIAVDDIVTQITSNNISSGLVVEFKHSVECMYDHGTFSFNGGNICIRIDTNSNEDEDEYDEEEWSSYDPDEWDDE